MQVVSSFCNKSVNIKLQQASGCSQSFKSVEFLAVYKRVVKGIL